MARKDGDRQAGLRTLVHRLAADGALRTGWSPDGVLDVLWLLTSFQTYDQLRCRSGMSVEQAGEVRQ